MKDSRPLNIIISRHLKKKNYSFFGLYLFLLYTFCIYWTWAFSSVIIPRTYWCDISPTYCSNQFCRQIHQLALCVDIYMCTFTCAAFTAFSAVISISGFFCGVFCTLFGVKVGTDCVQQKQRNVFFQFLFQLDEDGSQTLETGVSGIYVLLAFIDSVSSILPVIVHLLSCFKYSASHV